MKKQVKLPGLSGVGPGKSISLPLPVGVTYDALILHCYKLPLAKLKNIQIRVGTETIVDLVDGTALEALNGYYKRGATTVDVNGTGDLILWFIRKEMCNAAQRQVFGLGLADVQTASFHATIAADAAADCDLSLSAVQSPGTLLGTITKIRTFTHGFAGSGEVEIPDIPRGNMRIAAMHMLCDQSVTDVALEINTTGRFIDQPVASLHKVAEDFAGRDAQASYTHLDFILDGDLYSSFNTTGITDMRIKPKIAVAGSTVNTIVEYLSGVK